MATRSAGPKVASNGSGHRSVIAGVLLWAWIVLAMAGSARAQDDGPRVYMLAPVGAQSVTEFAVVKRGNEEPEVGFFQPNSEINTDLLITRYVRTFDLGGRQFSPFIILPVGKAETKTSLPGAESSESSSGLGDVQIGGVVGLLGSPALSSQEFAAYKPGLSVGLFAKVYVPTGAYSSSQSVNLGSNRLAIQLGLPTTFAMGTSYRDPSLTTIELFPTFTFYQDNTAPAGGGRSQKDALFSFEGHLTHNLSQKVWISADMLFRSGGGTTTDGVSNGNATHGWSAGGSAAVVLGPVGTLILTYEKVIERSDNGPDGWFFRTALVLPF
jgi:hypothetical protein